ncbi:MULTISPECIES: basic amino acid/polyamine antiporter [Achromobacter]|uniref:basic amino acid/polyamine antiporter n=1 Tax=Achromobacter TaxID=222 RepID=UPI00244682EE|nr:basic amino acid/polyamine antiporter [Achromobacter mucicolens]MDH0094136.1 basic amino acid/polyamine antiporter [Achromobacter mucicolens]
MSVKPLDQKLGLVALVAIVVSSMIGSGVDSLPQNMAETSALGPVIIAWLISGFGMFFIAKTFMVLSDVRPDLQSGIYMYAREGFGPLSAFVVAWGYWLMTIFSNVAFAVMVMDTLNYFMPGDFTGGNNLPSIIGASILIWGFHALVLGGTKMAGMINTVGTIVKLVPLVVFVGAVTYFLNYAELSTDIWGQQPAPGAKPLGSILSQTLSPMYVALWCFIGVEGAVALSGRARNKKDVGRATLIGFILGLLICLIVSVLPFGVLSQQTLSTIPNPSTAGVMKHLTGDWGEWLINLGVLISILTSWLAWTMICAEIPQAAGRNGTFPKVFATENNKGSASTALWVSSGIMQCVVLMVYFSHHAWLTLLGISAICVLPAYFASAAYLLKICLNGEYRKHHSAGRGLAIFSSLVGTGFCLFMLYASNIQYIKMTPLLLTLGLPLFFWARRQDHASNAVLNGAERCALALLLAIDILVIALYFMGHIKL